MADSKNNRFYINPDADILTNMVQFIGDFAVQNICARFSPFETAQELIETGHFDVSGMLSFEDITWDTVFAKMKTVEFSNAHSTGDGRSDMSFYMEYADMIHDFNTDVLVDQFGEMSVAVSGYICLEIWENLKEQLLSQITDGIGFNGILSELKKQVAPIVIDSIRKYCTESPNEIAEELAVLFETTQTVFTNIEHDETAFFKVIFASVVKGTEVMICNPEYLQLGDRIKSAVKYYASGVSVAIGDKLSTQINTEQFPIIDKYAPQVIEYIPTLISMAVTCAIVITVDKNPMIIQLTDAFNQVPTITGNIALYSENAAAFEKMAAELAKIDLDELKRIIAGYDHLVSTMESITDPQELNEVLLAYYRDNGKELPWGNRTLEEHWADKSSRLVFK